MARSEGTSARICGTISTLSSCIPAAFKLSLPTRRTACFRSSSAAELRALQLPVAAAAAAADVAAEEGENPRDDMFTRRFRFATAGQ